MAKIISVINYKGGVGKTTMTLQLGVGLATLYNKKVLMVDLDPQCSLSLSTVDEHYWADWLERKGSVASVVQSFYDAEKTEIDPEWIIENALDRTWDTMPGNTPGLDLLPSHLDLPEFEMRLMSKKPRSIGSMEEFYLERYLVLKNALNSVRKKYDYILFDCPPNIYLIARNAIIASDYYLVPTIPDFISCYGIPFILQHIQNMQEEVREKGGTARQAKFLGIVRNRVRQAGGNLVNEHEEQSRKLRVNYADYLLETMIIDRIGVAESLHMRQNIYNSKNDKFSEIRKDFSAVVKEVVNRLQ
ncbi:MAG: AAA family ATPase [bacterium]|nr:AAA family ATPase [bacterium]